MGTICTCGIGTNLYLSEIVLDIKDKHAVDFIGVLDEASYRAELWDHKPITDFCQIADGKATRPRNHGTTTIADIKAYRSKSKSLSNGQVLMRDWHLCHHLEERSNSCLLMHSVV